MHLLVAGAAVFACLVWIAESRRAGPLPAGLDSRPNPGSGIPAEYLTKGTGVKIVSFYTATGVISRGDTALVCYSVLNAATVRITPPVAELSPSLSRCVAVSPRKTTTYQLDAEGSDGSRATSSFELRVDPAPPKIEMLTVSAKEIQRGQPFDMCYTVSNASSLRLEPADVAVAPAEKRCYRWFPLRTTTYTLTAAGDRGRRDTLTFTVRVKER